MAKIIKKNIDLVKGDTGEIKFKVKVKKNKRKVAFDFTQYDDIQLGFYDNDGNLVIINVDKTDTENNDLKKGIIYFLIPLSITKKFIPDSELEYDVQITKGNVFRKTLIGGVLKIQKEINNL